jgi:hypothetical protein
MKIKELIKKVEKINNLKNELELNKKVYIYLIDKYDESKKLYTLKEYKSYIKRYEKEEQDILNNKEFIKNNNNSYELNDVFYIGIYDNKVNFTIEIRESNEQ